MEELSIIEKAILQEIIEENKKEYPFLVDHYPYLYVINREYTGVGVYVNFGYKKEVISNEINILLSAEKKLVVEGFDNEISYVLDITNGKYSFIEIVTNGDDIIENGEKINFKLI